MLHCTYAICKKCGKKFAVTGGGVVLNTNAADRLMNRICPACERKISRERFTKRKNMLLNKFI